MSRFLEYLLRLKPGELAGADKLVPTFAADYDNWVILGLAAGFLGLAALTVYSYLREGNTPRRVKLTIAGLRIAVILVIFLMLCQPGVVLRYKRTVYSTVVVLVDDSLSMSLKDHYADPKLRQAVADKLGVETDGLDQITRREMVLKILARQGGPLAELTKEHKLVLMRFSTAEGPYTQRIAELPVAEDDEKLVQTTMTVQRELMGKLAAGGYETNLARALRQAADRVQGRRVAAIVVVSDGQVTATGGLSAGNPLQAALAQVRKRHIPVHAVAVGDPEPRKNVKLTRLQGPTRVRRGSEVELTAYLASYNCGGQTVRVDLLRRPAGDKSFQPTGVGRSVRLAGEPGSAHSAEQKVALRHASADLGDFEYRAEVKPLERESDADDNAAQTRVKVTDEKLKVLLVSGDGGWECQFLRNLLIRSPERYAVSTWQQNADKEFNQEASTGMALSRLPRTRKELFQYEVVVLYDPAYTEGGFDGQFAKVAEDFLANHHGGLCYIAGNKHTDANLANPGPFEPLANVLPVVLDRLSVNIAERITRGQPRAWPVLPTAVGLDHPMLRLGRDEKDNLQVWHILPGVYWTYPVARLKPLASALAVNSDPRRRVAGSAGDPAPIIAVQYYGKGRSVFLGADETWRWRYLEDSEYYRRFWHNVMDFLASGKLQRHRVILTTGGEKFSVGEKLRIRAEAYDTDYRPLTDEKFTVQMTDRATGKVQKIEMTRGARKKAEGRYEAELKLVRVGTFELTAKADDPTYKGLVAGKTITVVIPEEERRHPEADPKTLQTIAPGKHFMMIHESDRLGRAVPSGKLTLYNDVPRDLWDVPLAMALIVLLLGIEWALRKKYNMA